MNTNIVLQDKEHIFQYGYASKQGKREEMEDYLSITSNSFGEKTAMFGIFDGHGGISCSHYCAENFASVFSKKYKEKKNFKDSINATITQINQTCMQEYPDSGTTVSVACILPNDELTIANLGDSKVLIYERGKKPVCATADHRVSNPKERALLLKRNKWCIYGDKICGRLSLSRCIGDSSMNDCIIKEPNIFTIKKKSGLRIIMATDGIWDFVRDDEITKIIWSSKNPTEAAQRIQETASKHMSRDNMSVLVIFL